MAYGAAEVLGWLVDEKQIAPNVLVRGSLEFVTAGGDR